MSRTKLAIVNIVSASRIAAAVAIVALAMNGSWWWALAVAIIGFLTDHVDGRYARRWNVVSPFGMFFDPLTDKILCLTVIAVMAVWSSPWFWIIFVIFALYDTTTTTLRLAFAGRLKMPAHSIAKLKTATQMISLVVLLLAMAIPQPLHNPVLALGTLVLVCAAGLTLISLYRYIRFVASFITKDWLELSPGVMEIDFKKWHDDYGVTTVLFDIEGTIAEYSQHEVSVDMAKVIKELHMVGISNVGIVTNILRRDSARVEKIAKQLDIALFRYPAGILDRKPSRTMARSILAEMDVKPSEAAFVGDKIVDVLVGARLKMPRVAWVDRLGKADHIVEKHAYRPIEKILKLFVRPA